MKTTEKHSKALGRPQECTGNNEKRIHKRIQTRRSRILPCCGNNGSKKVEQPEDPRGFPWATAHGIPRSLAGPMGPEGLHAPRRRATQDPDCADRSPRLPGAAMAPRGPREPPRAPGDGPETSDTGGNTSPTCPNQRGHPWGKSGAEGNQEATCTMTETAILSLTTALRWKLCTKSQKRSQKRKAKTRVPNVVPLQHLYTTKTHHRQRDPNQAYKSFFQPF